MTTVLKVVLADDEPLARQLLRDLLAAHPEITIVGEAEDGDQASILIREQRPDVVFLDIRMPGADGFEVLRDLPADVRPLVVFVTAFDQLAVRAFDVDADDFLVKPVDPRRFEIALGRLKARLDARRRPLAVPADTAAVEAPAWCEQFTVREREAIRFVKASEVIWIDAQGNYGRLHTAEGRFLVRQTMAAIEASLDPRRYLRIHRRVIVNLGQVQKIVSRTHGEYAFTLKDGSELVSGRSYNAAVTRLFS